MAMEEVTVYGRRGGTGNAEFYDRDYEDFYDDFYDNYQDSREDYRDALEFAALPPEQTPNPTLTEGQAFMKNYNAAVNWLIRTKGMSQQQAQGWLENQNTRDTMLTAASAEDPYAALTDAWAEVTDKGTFTEQVLEAISNPFGALGINFEFGGNSATPFNDPNTPEARDAEITAITSMMGSMGSIVDSADEVTQMTSPYFTNMQDDIDVLQARVD